MYVHYIQACRGDIPNNLCDRLREITLPDDISDDNINKSMNLLVQLRDATANSVSVVEETRHAFESYHNSTVSYLFIIMQSANMCMYSYHTI